MKLNIDAAYKDQVAGAGMVLRDSQDEVVFSACRSLQNCQDATEAELLALEEGLRLALHWTLALDTARVLGGDRPCRGRRAALNYHSKHLGLCF